MKKIRLMIRKNVTSISEIYKLRQAVERIEKPLTPKQQLKLEVDTMKKDTNKPEQVKTLLDFGLTKKQIRELENENK